MGSVPHSRPPAPADFTLKPTCVASTPTWASLRHAALFWFDFGLKVIPANPGSKRPAVLWDSWLDGLSRSRINARWSLHPSDEVGFIVGDEYIVLDADTPEALAALNAAEVLAGVTPLLVVRTGRGEHHYYRRDTDSLPLPSARDFPKHLDVLTGRKMVILPPSTGKVIVKMGASQ